MNTGPAPAHRRRTGEISAIDPATVQAYRETDYHILEEPPLTLRVDAASAELILLHVRYRVRSSAFITACNPLGRPAAAAVNARRQQSLLAELSRRGLGAIGGIGQHPTNGWPGEPSFLVPGATRRLAQVLGRQFEQNAILWSGADAVPELILLR